MPSLKTPSPEPKTSDQITSSIDHIMSSPQVTSSDVPSVELHTGNAASDSLIEHKHKDEVQEDQVASKDEVVQKILELSQSDEPCEEVSNSVGKDEPVELDTIRINPIVFDNNHIALPNNGNRDNSNDNNEIISDDNTGSTVSPVNEVSGKKNENAELSEELEDQAGENCEEVVVENKENCTISHDEQSDENAVKSDLEPNGNEINTHSSYILLKDSDVEKQQSDVVDEEQKSEDLDKVSVVKESDKNGENDQTSVEIEDKEKIAAETEKVIVSSAENKENCEIETETVQDNSQSEVPDHNITAKPDNVTPSCSDNEVAAEEDTKNNEVELAQNDIVDNSLKVIIPKVDNNEEIKESVDDKTSLNSANSHENSLKPDDKDLERVGFLSIFFSIVQPFLRNVINRSFAKYHVELKGITRIVYAIIIHTNCITLINRTFSISLSLHHCNSYT